jgi:hypothetical protein
MKSPFKTSQLEVCGSRIATNLTHYYNAAISLCLLLYIYATILKRTFKSPAIILLKPSLITLSVYLIQDEVYGF